MIKAGIFGATGYTGAELVKILTKHSEVEICFATSQSYAGKTLDELYPTVPAMPLIAPENAPIHLTDVVFLCLPHAAAAATAVKALNAGNRVIDLSADFRLKDENVYEEWYGPGHPAPELLSKAVYGLTEFARKELPGAELVATPGCYPTSILLALQPLLAAQVDISCPIIADSKSGVSGAGRSPKQLTHFVEATENFSPYKIGRSHRHVPEMEQTIASWHNSPPPLIFSPHLLPVKRGILSTIYIPLVNKWHESDLFDLYADQYADEPFVKLLHGGQLATLNHVNYTNQCAISLHLSGSTLIVTSAIDNLLKGASGQAVQNMNVVYEIPETIGLN